MDHITVLLVGGPAELVRQDSVQDVPSMTEQVKVAHCGGYEHYRYSGGSRRIDGRTLPVFEWCARTKVAE